MAWRRRRVAERQLVKSPKRPRHHRESTKAGLESASERHRLRVKHQAEAVGSTRQAWRRATRNVGRNRSIAS